MDAQSEDVQLSRRTTVLINYLRQHGKAAERSGQYAWCRFSRHFATSASAGIWMFLARRLATSTYTMDWLCLSDGWPLSSCQSNSNWGNASKGDVSQAPTKHGDYDLEVVGGLVMVRRQQEDGYSFSVKHDPLIDLGSLLNFLMLPHTTTTSD